MNLKTAVGPIAAIELVKINILETWYDIKMINEKSARFMHR
jgi:hypothetical protein